MKKPGKHPGASRICAFALAVCAFFMTGCTGQQQLAEPISFTEIQFGEGGGFTGKNLQYLLRADGNLYSIDNQNQGQQQLLKKVPDPKLAKIDTLITEAWHIEDIANDPGNINMNINLNTEKGNRNYRWGRPGEDPPEEIRRLWDTLRALPSE